MYKHRITVFTPTYNRAYIIGKLYDSLCKQSFKDFEWLVVDDGSSDNTNELFGEWIKEADFTIRYYKTENGGKHRAINYGLDKANGELFFTMDSDDELTVDALEKIDKWAESIAEEKDICGIVANKGITMDSTPNYIFASPFLDKTWIATYTYQENGTLALNGERAIILYTDFHKKYPFPEFNGEKFITEAVVYNRIANDGHKMRFYNDIIWIYEYHEDGLTKAGNVLFLNNPRGYGLWLKEKSVFTKTSVLDKLRMYYNFACELSEKYPTKTIAECIDVSPSIIKLSLLIHNLLNKLRGNN